MSAADLTVVANLHREGPLAFTALASAFAAAEAAERQGTRCRVLAVLDRPDEATRREAARFSERLEGVVEIDAGDLGAARNEGLARVDTPWAALLDGDDLFDRDWLWKGLRHLREAGSGNSVAHARVRLTFGAERHGRVQLSTGSPFFHPLHLLLSWHWAADTIGPTDLFRSLPFVPNDHARGLGAEDWLWSCESVAAGVRHLVVPETAYFYRRQARVVSLGMVPGITFRRTRLFQPEVVARWADRPGAVALSLADRVDWPGGPAERWGEPPAWLREAVRRAADLDLDLHALARELDAVPVETMPLFPASAGLWLKMLGTEEERERVVLLCDRPTPELLGPLAGFVGARAEWRGRPLELLVLALAPPEDPARPPSPQPERVSHHDEGRLRVRHLDLGADEAYRRLWEAHRQELLVRFLVQTRPLLAAGLDSWAFDRVVARWSETLRASGVRTARLLGSRFRGERGPSEAVGALDRSAAAYDVFACADAGTAKWLAERLPTPSQSVVGPAAREDLTEGHAGALLAALLERAGGAPPVPLAAPADGRDDAASAAAGKPDVSCLLVVRSSGWRLVGALRALAGAREELERTGKSCEVLVLPCRPGPRTRAVLATLGTRLPGALLLPPERDDGAAVNAGAAAARGTYVAILDARWAVSRGFLAEALGRAAEEGPEAIVRPRYVVEAGERAAAAEQAGTGEADLDVGLLSTGDLWAPVALLSRELLLRFPWHASAPESGFDEAAWHWSCETVRGGCRHVVAPRTAAVRPVGEAADRDLGLGRTGAGVLPPTGFLTDHPWLEREGPRSSADTLGLPKGWCDATYLNAYPDVAHGVRSGAFPSGWAHYCICGRGEGRVAAWRRPGPASGRFTGISAEAARRARLGAGLVVEKGRRLLSRTFAGRGLAERERSAAWLAGEMRRAADSVPELRGREVEVRDRSLPGRSRGREAWRRAWGVVAKARPTHLLLVPRLGPGGGELAARLAAEAILSRKENRVLLVTTDTERDGGAERLGERAAVLPFGALAAELTPEEQVGLLARLVVNAPSRTLHVFYSHVGWEALRRHAAPIASGRRLFVSIFSVPPPETGLDAGYARLLAPIRRHVASVFTDNALAAAALESACGLEPGQAVALRHPVSPRPAFRRARNGDERILWAGRLDADKRPDLLRRIAELLPHRTFDVWGTPVLDDGRLFAPLRALPNVRLRGRFAGFGAIPDAPYGCFLYTSLWDGLPNVLLEAVASGLLAVASDVGAVHEVLGEGRGLLVRPPDDAEAYVAALEGSRADAAAAREVAERGRRHVLSVHTREAFLATLASAPGYL